MVHQADIGLCRSVSLLGRAEEPLKRHLVVLRHALSLDVQLTELVLGLGAAPVGCELEQPNGFVVILSYAPSGRVHVPEIVLCCDVALVGCETEQPDGFLVVLRYAPPCRVREAAIVQCGGVG